MKRETSQMKLWRGICFCSWREALEVGHAAPQSHTGCPYLRLHTGVFLRH